MPDLDIEGIVLFYVVLLISLVIHEASHALFAFLGGDRTAYLGGQLTLNPLPHIRREPTGTVVLPLIMLFASNGTMCFGYAHAPIDARWAERHPKRAALMSAAGPLSNLLLVVLAFGLMKSLIMLGYASNLPSSPLMITPNEQSGAIYALARIATAFVFLNVFLAVLNLIPLPPLDGAGVVEGLFPRIAPLYAMIRSQPILILGVFILLMQTGVLSDLSRPIIRSLIHWM